MSTLRNGNEGIDRGSDFDRELTDLEREVGYTAFPFTRASYLREKLGVDEKDADSEKLSAALGRWFAFLSSLKRLKDSGSPAWNKMCNWD